MFVWEVECMADTVIKCDFTFTSSSKYVITKQWLQIFFLPDVSNHSNFLWELQNREMNEKLIVK